MWTSYPHYAERPGSTEGAMKATAKAPANIAFIKYWGKADEELRLPLNDSLSMNLTGAHTITTVEFDSAFSEDSVEIINGEFSEQEKARVKKVLTRIRERVGSELRARVVTKNTFPKGAGSAASASGFAALTLAGFAALGITFSEKELTIFARMGSGSACRSIPDGFAVWEKGIDNESSFAYSLYPADYWNIRDILVIVDKRMKKVSTTDGMERVATSPKLAARLNAVPRRMLGIKEALEKKNFVMFGSITEEDCLDMHAVMQSQVPPLMYWSPVTQRVMAHVARLRAEGIPVYFTIDAGPNVHIICEGKDELVVGESLRQLPGIEEIIYNKPARGAHIVSTHLF